MSSQVNKNKALAEDVVAETYPTTIWYDLFFFFESGTWVTYNHEVYSGFDFYYL